MAYGIGRYKRNDIETADRRKIVVLLYEGAVVNLRRAATMIVAGDKKGQSEQIHKTLAILKFLANALDFERGGDLAFRLDSLYSYMRDTLTLADIECDAGKVSQVANLFGTLLEGWRGVMDQAPVNVEDRSRNETVPDGASPPNPMLRAILAG